MKFIIKIDNALHTIEKCLVIAFVFSMVLLSFLQVTLRLFFHSGIVWMDPLLRHMVLWSGLLGSAMAARFSRHFALDIAHKIIPEKIKKIVFTTMNLFTATISLFLFWAAMKFLRDESAAESIAFHIGKTAVNAALAESILPAVFLLIAFHFLVNIFRSGENEA